jgi:hypothetical protein
MTINGADWTRPEQGQSDLLEVTTIDRRVVGFGVVIGSFKKRLPGFRAPEPFGCLRKLSPFKPVSAAPKQLKIMDALRQIAALHQLHPRRRRADREICEWMERRLKVRNRTATRDGR